MEATELKKLIHWLSQHQSVFLHQETREALKIKELYSSKELTLQKNQIATTEHKTNSLNPQESYVVLLFSNGHQLVLATQGFVFPPDFSATGPLDLPSPLYCMQDFQQLFHRLEHVAAEAERGREALDLIMVLIAILDGAKLIGLEMDGETRAVEEILSQLEKGQTLPPVHPE